MSLLLKFSAERAQARWAGGGELAREIDRVAADLESRVQRLGALAHRLDPDDPPPATALRPPRRPRTRPAFGRVLQFIPKNIQETSLTYALVA